jgi:hypothetical protein
MLVDTLRATKYVKSALVDGHPTYLQELFCTLNTDFIRGMKGRVGDSLRDKWPMEAAEP